MATLSVTYTYAPGGVIRASEHNQNMTDIINWANGNISDENFDTLTGTVSWNVTSNSLAASIINTGTEGSLGIQHNATLASGKSAVKVSSNAVQSAGSAIVDLSASSASNAIPVLKVTDAGIGGSALSVISTTKPSIPFPVMTTTQRNALTSPAIGMGIYNSTLLRHEVYNGTHWVDMGGRTGSIVDYAGTDNPPDTLGCDGSEVSRTTYAALFAKIGTTWGVGNGTTTFNIPDLRGRTSIGAGQGAGLTNRTLAGTGGEETHTLTTSEMPTHNHDFTGTGTAASTGAHTHDLTIKDGGIGSSTIPLGSNNTGSSHTAVTESSGAHSHSVSVSGTTDDEGTGNSHNIMQPYAVVLKYIII